MPTFPFAVRNAELDARNAAVLREFALEADVPAVAVGATAGGDERRLRGIPAIARGVAGAIPGSSPGRRLLLAV